MVNAHYFIKLETPNSNEYFLSINGADIKTVPEMSDAVPFDTLESATALINYVLPTPLMGSWKVVKSGTN
jgi:hypothetical protein